ncbi:MAG: MFS transporter [Caldimicrobium sp.]
MFSELLGPFKIRNFRLFLLGHFISFVGTWIQNTALHWIIYNHHKSTSELGLFTFLTTFPSIFITLLSGILIDRVDRKKLLQILLFMSLFPPMIMGLLIYRDYFNFWLFAFLGFLSAAISSIDMPLRQVFISEIVPPLYLTKALSLQAFSFNSARMLGPTLAGFILDFFHVSLCFFLNFLSFIPLFVFTFLIKVYPKEKNLTKNPRFFQEISMFLLFLRKNFFLIEIILVTGIFTFFCVSVIILLPMLTTEVLSGRGKDFAFLSSSLGIGALLGALSVFFRREINSKSFQLILAHLLWSIGIIGLIFGKTFFILFLSMLIIGASYTNFYPIVNSFLQENTPSPYRGKVMSLFSVAFLGTAPLGQMFTGFMIEYFSYKWWLIIMLILVLIINLSFIKRIKKIERGSL